VKSTRELMLLCWIY